MIMSKKNIIIIFLAYVEIKESNNLIKHGPLQNNPTRSFKRPTPTKTKQILIKSKK